MIKRITAYVLALILGLALGPASALYTAGLWPGAKPLDFGNVEIDGWRSDFAIGSEAADPYTRARIARHGLLALSKKEAVYFTRATDSAGRPLVEKCSYAVSGEGMPAEWWSITLYDRDSKLPINDDEALSLNALSVEWEDDRYWGATISSQRPNNEPNWISSRNASTFDLTLRLYMPTKGLLEDPEASFVGPTVSRISCAEDAT